LKFVQFTAYFPTGRHLVITSYDIILFTTEEDNNTMTSHSTAQRVKKTDTQPTLADIFNIVVLH